MNWKLQKTFHVCKDMDGHVFSTVRTWPRRHLLFFWLQREFWQLFTTCLLAKLYHPAYFRKVFGILSDVYILGPANSAFSRVVLKDNMSLQSANSALEVEVTQRGLIWERRRKVLSSKGLRLLPLHLALGLGELGGCCCWRDEAHGKCFRGRNLLFKVQIAFLLFGRRTLCVVWHKIPCSNAFRMWN